jgi:hypothetical protein
MKTKRFTEQQILGFPKEAEAEGVNQCVIMIIGTNEFSI